MEELSPTRIYLENGYHSNKHYKGKYTDDHIIKLLLESAIQAKVLNDHKTFRLKTRLYEDTAPEPIIQEYRSIREKRENRSTNLMNSRFP